MKTNRFVGPAVVFLVATITFTSCSENDPMPANYAGGGFNTDEFTITEENATTTLSIHEISSLIYVREEEKVARDVYIALYEKWQMPVFSSISTSEQSHMDAMLVMIEKFDLTDPVGSNPPGVFTNAELQALYNELVAKGSVSLMEGLKVGATIEDLDLYDLQERLTKIHHEDVRLVFENLLKGSRNHLRAFYSNILLLGGSYEPQYITQEEFDAVVESETETGTVAL